LRGDPQEAPAAKPPDKTDAPGGQVQRTAESRLDELLQERLGTLKELVRLTEQTYRKGITSFPELQRAKTMLLKAELEACKSAEARIEVLEQSVTMARESEKFAQRLLQAGQEARAGVMAAKVDRLETEIALEREKAKAATPPK